LRSAASPRSQISLSTASRRSAPPLDRSTASCSARAAAGLLRGLAFCRTRLARCRDARPFLSAPDDLGIVDRWPGLEPLECRLSRVGRLLQAIGKSLLLEPLHANPSTDPSRTGSANPIPRPESRVPEGTQLKPKASNRAIAERLQ
jgi:hypothetical protein